MPVYSCLQKWGRMDFTRNPLGQVKTAESPHVSYQYAYDTSQRLNAVVDNRNNKTLNYNYSPGGKLNSLIDSDGNRTDYLYDIAGNLTGIWAANVDFIGFNYDRAGRMTNKWMFNGVNTAYNYNDDNTLASMTNRSGVLPVSNHAYTYDVLANRSAQAETINGSTINYVYSYDELNRLIQVDNGTAAEQQAYEYDPLNNRTFKRIGTAEQAYVYDAANQLQQIRNSTPAGALLANLNYDLNGNLTGRTDTNASYIYDARDQMVQVNIPSELSQFYNYDDSGRRISKTIGTLATQYLYNGDTLINEYDGLTGNSQAYYTHGARLDEVLMNQTPTDTYYYHSDALNSVVSATDALGIAQSTAKFDAWGNVVSSTGAAQHFGYTGREPDETGLIYYRARYYDAELGRFTQRDPIGLGGGINLYAYVSNKPTIFTDPFGLEPGDIFAVTPAATPTRSDKVNLGAQKKFQSDAKYIHLAIEILPDAQGNRRIAETLVKEGVQIISLKEFSERNSGEGRIVDVFTPVTSPLEKGLKVATDAAIKLAMDNAGYDWSEIFGNSDASDPADGSICSNLCNYLSDLAGTGQIAGHSRRNGLVIPSAITKSLNFKFSHRLEASGGFVVGDIFQ